jgi:integrase
MKTVTQDAADYLALRRSLGFKLCRHARCLKKFLAFLRRQRRQRITTQLALHFATSAADCGLKTQADRLSVVRGFARYRLASDPRTEVPPPGLLPNPRQRAQPYLYSEEEIRGLLTAALARPSRISLRPWTYACLFGLLAVTGMRASEALHLQLAQIDWENGVLTIGKSKFGKTRLLPLHPSTVAALADYAQRRQRYLQDHHLPPSACFFVSGKGQPVRKSNLDRLFWALSRELGWRSVGVRGGPRLHDLRHRFAVQTLVQWYRQGAAVEGRLPVLSTYLGHADVTYTYWYLSSTPELMAAASTRLEQRWKGLA